MEEFTGRIKFSSLLPPEEKILKQCIVIKVLPLAFLTTNTVERDLKLH